MILLQNQMDLGLEEHAVLETPCSTFSLAAHYMQSVLTDQQLMLQCLKCLCCQEERGLSLRSTSWSWTLQVELCATLYPCCDVYTCWQSFTSQDNKAEVPVEDWVMMISEVIGLLWRSQHDFTSKNVPPEKVIQHDTSSTHFSKWLERGSSGSLCKSCCSQDRLWISRNGWMDGSFLKPFNAAFFKH